jgi:Uma2 family endonuclease
VITVATAVLDAPLKAPVTEELLTAEEYLASGRTEGTELIDGRIVEVMPPIEIHGEIALAIGSLLRPFVRQHDLGRVYVETGFRLKRNPDKVQAPDVSFLEKSRLPQGNKRFFFIEGAPTLAVEVISPHERWDKVEGKIRLYFEAGAKVVWLVEPRRRAVTVRRPDAAPVTYIEGDIVPGGEILPGFELPVADIFA